MNTVRYTVIVATWYNLVVFSQTRVNINVAIKKINEKFILNNILNNYVWTDFDDFIIRAAFFIGYAASQFIGGLLVLNFGPKKTIFVCLLITAILNFLTPVATNFGITILIIIRVLLGILSGPLYPATQQIISVWSPKKEKTTLSSFTHSGNIFGISIGHIIGGLMCDSIYLINGWKYYFYFGGSVTSLGLIIWSILMYDSPNEHPWISQNEKTYIEETTFKKTNSSEKIIKNTPFLKIIKSFPVFCLTCGLFGHLTIFFCLLTNHIKFLTDVHKFSTLKASNYSNLPFIAHFLVLVTYPMLIDYLITKKNIKITFLRKFSSGIAFVGSLIFLFPIGFISKEYSWLVILSVSMAMGFLGLNFSGFFISVIEIAPKYSSIIMGINSTVGSCSGFITTLLCGSFIKKFGNEIGWKYSFMCVSVFAFLMGMVYVIFGTSKLQEWAVDNKSDK